MQTTLRIDDRLYREAKAEAARQGMTLTRFLEDGIRLCLERKQVVAGKVHQFRVFESARASRLSPEEIERIAREEQEQHDLAKLGLTPSGN